MPNDLALSLEQAVHSALEHLLQITEKQAGAKPAPDHWSKKEELGHLVDSATNNHVRFVRATLEPEFRGLGYQQEEWVRLHGYQEMPWPEILEFWRRYNGLLAALVRRIPESQLQTPCTVGDSAQVTLGFLIEDYTLHMQHHLDHILESENVRQYPGAALGV